MFFFGVRKIILRLLVLVFVYVFFFFNGSARKLHFFRGGASHSAAIETCDPVEYDALLLIKLPNSIYRRVKINIYSSEMKQKQSYNNNILQNIKTGTNFLQMTLNPGLLLIV